MPLDANEASELSNSWAQDSPGHCHRALTLLPPESSMSGALLGVYSLKSQHPPQSFHSQRQAEMVKLAILDLTKSKPSPADLAVPNEDSTVSPHSSSRCDGFPKSWKKGHSHAQDAQEYRRSCLLLVLQARGAITARNQH